VDETAEYFDGWYADMVDSPELDAIVQRHLGLPPSLLSTSLLSWDAIGDVEEALRLSPGATVLDLACGRGGYGLEIAARTGAHLLGVDFSAEAIRQATALAERLGRQATFQVGDIQSTGLDDASVEALFCIDAIQFVGNPAAAYRELRRVLVPGGRAVLTSWTAVDPADDRVPERVRHLDLADGLAKAGFLDVTVREQDTWRAAERALWEEAAALEPGDDPSLQSLRDEAQVALPMFELTRRVMAVATTPSPTNG
jgi:SAM-dependent methyltransferase